MNVYKGGGPVFANINEYISGGISGAITDPFSKEAYEHAVKAYGAIRKSKTDIDNIARNTGYTKDQISMIKDFLFNNEHDLGDERKRFDPDFYIAQSWHRMAFEPENIKEHDLMLLKHELSEMALITQGYSQQEAHEMTNERGMNYQAMSDKYYNALDEKQHHNKDINAGAVIYHRQHSSAHCDDFER